MINKYKLLSILTLLTFGAILMPQVGIAQTVDPNAIVETAVRMVFANTPDMISIAKCESGFRQFAPDGSVLHGGNDGNYVGIFQFDQNLHTAKALSLGYDINTIDGNLGYAKYVYSISGTNPWKSCLSSTATPPPAPTASEISAPLPTGRITATLDFGITSSQVLLLQQILNNKGYQLALSGPGSPGNETNMFGPLTRAAVQKFQCDKGIVCSGTSYTTGFGRVGPLTKAALNNL